jgi:hypothetical protein
LFAASRVLEFVNAWPCLLARKVVLGKMRSLLISKSSVISMVLD